MGNDGPAEDWEKPGLPALPHSIVPETALLPDSLSTVICASVSRAVARQMAATAIRCMDIAAELRGDKSLVVIKIRFIANLSSSPIFRQVIFDSHF
jgi:hypothetical protein